MLFSHVNPPMGSPILLVNILKTFGYRHVRVPVQGRFGVIFKNIVLRPDKTVLISDASYDVGTVKLRNEIDEYCG